MATPGSPVAVRPSVHDLALGRKSPLRIAAAHAGAHAGFLVTTATFSVLYANTAAVRILGFPRETVEPALIGQQLRTLFPGETAAVESSSEALLVSGQRTYICRPFLLDGPIASARAAMLGFLLERPFHREEGIRAVQRRFHLSPREFESVQYLVGGLTTKEIAARMKVSPNTVKQYVRLVMSKMGVTTRAGIVGQLLRA